MVYKRLNRRIYFVFVLLVLFAVAVVISQKNAKVLAVEANTLKLNVGVSGNGAVSSNPVGINSCTSDCSAQFVPDSRVELTATPAAGETFVKWRQRRAGIMIPLYSHNWTQWDRVRDIKIAHPKIPIGVIANNPGSGPGESPDPEELARIEDLTNNDVLVLGYVYTQFDYDNDGNLEMRNIQEVKEDIVKWKTFYPKTMGIFLDVMRQDSGQESYYSTLTAYAKAQGFSFVVGNPGARPDDSYLPTVDSLVVREDRTYPNINDYSVYESYNNQQFAMMLYGLGLDRTWVTGASTIIGWIYITDDYIGRIGDPNDSDPSTPGDPNNWNSLPPYLENLAEHLDGLNYINEVCTTNPICNTRMKFAKSIEAVFTGESQGGITITKAADRQSAQPGQTITYDITFTVGSQPVTNAIIEDNIPLGTSFVSASVGGVYDAQSQKVTWTLPANLDPNSSGLVTLSVGVL